MTTPITKEQLQRIIEISDEVISAVAGTNEDVHQEIDEMIRLWDCLNDVVAPPEVVRELARIALASLEAEAVAWLLSGGGAKNNVSFDSGNAYADPLREVTPLYTAPPAPPAYKKTENFTDYHAGWNACRAAMLNHSEHERDMVEPVSQPYKLPERVTNALTLSLQAMEFMGDTLNNLDAVCKEDVEFVAPAFEAVRAVLAGNFRGNEDSSTKIFREIAETSTNSPAIPDGWQLVPVEPTKEMIDAGWLHFMGTKNPSSKGTYKAMLAAAPQQEESDGQ
ncbi:hypothetical protein [Pseudocitrobacter corydidari]